MSRYNYKGIEIAGEAWHRSNGVNIQNKYNTIPTIEFYEEKIVQAGNDILATTTGTLKESLTSPLTEFEILDPDTGISVGQKAQYKDIYILLHSLYIHLATLRDQELENQPIQEEP